MNASETSSNEISNESEISSRARISLLPINIRPSEVLVRAKFFNSEYAVNLDMVTNLKLRELPYTIPECEVQEMRLANRPYQFRNALHKYGWVFDLELVYINDNAELGNTILILQGCEVEEIILDMDPNDVGLYAKYIIHVGKIVDCGCEDNGDVE